MKVKLYFIKLNYALINYPMLYIKLRIMAFMYKQGSFAYYPNRQKVKLFILKKVLFAFSDNLIYIH